MSNTVLSMKRQCTYPDTNTCISEYAYILTHTLKKTYVNILKKIKNIVHFHWEYEKECIKKIQVGYRTYIFMQVSIGAIYTQVLQLSFKQMFL